MHATQEQLQYRAHGKTRAIQLIIALCYICGAVVAYKPPATAARQRPEPALVLALYSRPRCRWSARHQAASPIRTILMENHY